MYELKQVPYHTTQLITLTALPQVALICASLQIELRDYLIQATSESLSLNLN